MHICVIIPNTHPNKKLNLIVGGIANQLLQLLEQYKKYNLKITIVTKYSKFSKSVKNIYLCEIHKFDNLFRD